MPKDSWIKGTFNNGAKTVIYSISIGQVSGFPLSIVKHGEHIQQYSICPLCKRKVLIHEIPDTIYVLDGSLWPDYLCLGHVAVVSESVIKAWESRKLLGYTARKANVKVIHRGEHIICTTLDGEKFQVDGEATKLPAPLLQYYLIQINTIAMPNPQQTLVSKDDGSELFLKDFRGACQRCGLLKNGKQRAFPETVRLADDGLAGQDFAIWVGQLFFSQKVIDIAIEEKHTNLRWADCNQSLSWSETTAFMNKMRKAFKKSRKKAKD